MAGNRTKMPNITQYYSSITSDYKLHFAFCPNKIIPNSKHMILEKRLAEKLAQRQQNGNLRQLRTTKNLIDFCSNDYLGLAENQILKTKINRELVQFSDYKIGATGSRLISGNSEYAMQLEAELAQYFRGESALIFNSGYQANSGFLATIPQKGDTILCDEFIHASLREGTRLSFAEKKYFKHNNLIDLEQKLQKSTGEKFVILESVYSMDGDCGDLKNILDISDKYGAYVVLDEAHGVGIFGQTGNGLACAQGLESRFFARIYTFGKAPATHGACVVGSKILTDYLTNFSRAFIYTTALPFHALVSTRCAFEMIRYYPEIRMDLHRKIGLFRKAINDGNALKIRLKESITPIQILQIGGHEKTKRLAELLVRKGFDVRPILSPTVKVGAEIIRICLHAFNSDEEITNLATEIQEADNQVFD